MTHKGLIHLACFQRGFTVAAMAVVCMSLSSVTFAQSSPAIDSLESLQTIELSEGLNFNLPSSSSFMSETGPLLELPTDVVGPTLFKLDITAPGCAAGSNSCVHRADRMDMGLTDTFRVRSGKGLDLSLTPRASMRFDDEFTSTAVGAVIEIGEDLRSGAGFENNTWYFFAGADAEALSYSPGAIRQITSGEFHLQDRILVGDAQAGLGYRIGDADVSLSYMRREASTEEFTFKEDAAALSFTWKR